MTCLALLIRKALDMHFSPQHRQKIQLKKITLLCLGTFCKFMCLSLITLNKQVDLFAQYLGPTATTNRHIFNARSCRYFNDLARTHVRKPQKR